MAVIILVWAATLGFQDGDRVRADRFGIEPADATEVDKTLDAVGETGVGWVSVRIAWGDAETSLEPTDRILAGAKERGLKPFVTLLWRPYKRVLTPKGEDERDLAAFRSWVGGIVERYDGDGTDDAPGAAVVKHWGIERHLGTIPGRGAERKMELIAAARGAMIEADSEAKLVLGISATGDGVRKLKSLIARDVQNAFDVALYIAIKSPSSAPEQIRKARKALEDAGRDMESWVITSAVASGRRGSPKEQASEFVKRTCAYLRRDAEIKRIFWYPLADVKSDLDEPEQTKHDQKGGMITDRGTRRMLFDVIKRVTPLFKDGTDLEYVKAYGARGVTVYRMMHSDGRWTHFAWAKTTERMRSQLLLSTEKDPKITTIKGETKEAKNHSKGGKIIDLYNEPVIIEVP